MFPSSTLGHKQQCFVLVTPTGVRSPLGKVLKKQGEHRVWRRPWWQHDMTVALRDSVGADVYNCRDIEFILQHLSDLQRGDSHPSFLMDLIAGS